MSVFAQAVDASDRTYLSATLAPSQEGTPEGGGKEKVPVGLGPW